jgi:hypothetical protein
MANAPKSLSLSCPHCGAKLVIDPALEVVLSHEPPPKPEGSRDLGKILKGLGGEAAQREQRFKEQMQAEQQKGKVLDRKFQEGMKKAKDSPDPPARPFDYD